MKVTYFKAKSLDIYVLIVLKNGKDEQNDIILDEIKLLWKEADVSSYIDERNLEKLTMQQIKNQRVISDLIDLINDYLSGKKINLYDNVKKLNIELGFNEKFHTSFSQKVMKLVSQLKYGEITTYSDIGQKINSKAYRAIGTILKKNPIPLIIPCHRVLGKNGIGGFMGKTSGGDELNLKKNLLEIEGVVEYKITTL